MVRNFLPFCSKRKKRVSLEVVYDFRTDFPANYCSIWLSTAILLIFRLNGKHPSCLSPSMRSWKWYLIFKQQTWPGFHGDFLLKHPKSTLSLIKVATRKMSYETDISRPLDRLLTILAREENNISICKSLRKWTNQLSPRVGCYWGYYRPKPWGASRQNFAFSENCFYPFMSTNRHRLCNKKIFWGVLCNSNMGQIAYEEAKNFEFK